MQSKGNSEHKLLMVDEFLRPEFLRHTLVISHRIIVDQLCLNNALDTSTIRFVWRKFEVKIAAKVSCFFP